MCNYNNIQVSLYDPAKNVIHSNLRPEGDPIPNCRHNCESIVSFDDIVHFNDEKIILTYVDFDCGVTFYLETPRKTKHIN